MSKYISPGCHNFLNFPWFLMILTVLRRTGQVFCRMPLYLDLSDIFLMILLGLCFQGEQNSRSKVTFSSHHIRATCYLYDFMMVDVDFDHMAELMFVRFLHHKITLSPFPHCPLFKEVTMFVQPYPVFNKEFLCHD